MNITVNTVALASFLGVVATLLGVMVWIFGVRQRFLNLESHEKLDHETIILLAKASFATLDGLHQLGCNGEVTKARQALKEHVLENRRG